MCADYITASTSACCLLRWSLWSSNFAYVDEHGNGHLEGLLLGSERVGLHNEAKTEVLGVWVVGCWVLWEKLKPQNREVLELFVQELFIIC